MRDNVVKQKSYDFALRVIKLCLWLKEQKHFEMSRQLLKSGTSVGANIEEALAGQSRKDFLVICLIRSIFKTWKYIRMIRRLSNNIAI